jgi:iron complex outermembrane recepter protein
MKSKNHLLCGAASLALTFGLSEVALAQTLALEEIVVTARKREESLQEIPLAISVFSADDIDRSGFKGLEELSLQVAGLQYIDQGGQRPGRFNPAIRFRGMNVNSNIPTFQLGALFVDGIYVLGSTHSIPLDDLERVEVIKGPQAAYFGRNTFGGAVNYITKNPSTEEFSGKIQASGATYNEFDVSGSIEGPLVEGKVAARIGARLYSRGGMWTASDGGDLGE